FQPRAVKTGMLFSAEIIRVVVAFFSSQKIPLIVDPVMVATSGAPLLKPSAMKALQKELFPLATLVTPNLGEAEILLGKKIRSHPELKLAAQEIFERFGCAALIKGGHLPGAEALDFFYDGKTAITLRAKFIRGISTHGTGCTYSAAIAAYCALGHPLPESVRRAKQFVTRAIGESVTASGHFVLRNF
ncbi:MAG: bifunctional hydroxymethylpyrimidine kinase/phosphomethylpyrimidine kinase, partial [Verrucomicrobiota bacterium]